jgi:multicomponent Na+:H+ antiporter subunit F
MSGPFPLVTSLSLAMLGVALVLTFVRLARGPSTPDRVVALDLIALLAVGVIAVDSVHSGETALLGVATVLALLSFMGTVAFARYLEKKVSP